ncbi:syntaxin binding [Cystoisospora suis]|uniref:Syntaxin binding n=1 Tax=Cystoisospora suis TaxID=483139 RepID=A0A2C6KHP3_9APIC|nr:syntaxin binding [Cystoisospora suis]
MASLKAICKQRILREMIEHAVQNDSLTLRSPSPSSSLVNYVVLLVDENSLPILSSCCTVYDVLEQGVTVVEPVGKRRQPLPGLDAVYFLAPTIDSVDAVLHDFSDEKTPQYKSVHIFFTSALPPADKLLERFAACPPLLPRIKTFVEFNLDFVVQEQRVFHLGRPLDFIDFYKGGSDPVSRASIDAIATRLFSLCATLGEKPSIRFQKNFRGLSQSVASALHDKLQRSDLFKSSGSETGNVSLLILDRSIDVATLLVHEYTYQALVYDVLEIPTIALPSSSSPLKRGKSGRAPSTSSQEMNELLLQEDTFQYEIVSNAGKREQKRAILGEQDELWVRFRHSHIQSVNEEVQEEIQRFIRENATAKTQKEYQVNPHKQKENRRGRATPPATLEAIRALPQYQEMLAKVGRRRASFIPSIYLSLFLSHSFFLSLLLSLFLRPIGYSLFFNSCFQ